MTSPVCPLVVAITTGLRAARYQRGMPGPCRHYSMAAQRSSARRSPTRCPSASWARTPSTVRRSMCVRPAGSLVVRPQALPPPLLLAFAILRLAPTQAVRCACQRASAAFMESGRLMEGSTSPACCRRRRPPTRPDGSRAIPRPLPVFHLCCCRRRYQPHCRQGL